MKRTFVLLIVISLLATSLIGCGKTSEPVVDSPIVEQPADEQTAIIESNNEIIISDDETETTVEPVIPELEYALAPIHKEPMNAEGWTKLWLALEFKTLGYRPDGSDFVIKNKKTDFEFTDKFKTDISNLTIVGGVVCTVPHDDTFAFERNSEADVYQFVIGIEYCGDLDFADIEIGTNVTYEDFVNHIYTGQEWYSFELNADISDITTSPEIIHSSSLFELDGNYYYFETSFGGDSSSSGYTYTVNCINGTMDTFWDSVEENMEILYVPARASRNNVDIPGYQVFEVASAPDGYNFRIERSMFAGEPDEDEFYVGIATNDGSYPDDIANDMLQLIGLRITVEDGRQIIFILH